MARRLRKTRKSRRALRRRRITRKARRQAGGEIPDDLNTVVVAKNGEPGDIDAMEVPMSKNIFDETNAGPEDAV